MSGATISQVIEHEIFNGTDRTTRVPESPHTGKHHDHQFRTSEARKSLPFILKARLTGDVPDLMMMMVNA